jgi:DNA-binding MarR family transcriptional regulator
MGALFSGNLRIYHLPSAVAFVTPVGFLASPTGSLIDMRSEADSTATAIALTTAMRRLRSRLRQESPLGLAELTMPQALALARIVEEGPISNAALAAGEYMRPQSTHEMVLFLERRGFVERRADPADRRKLLIEVTASGRHVVTDLMGLRHQWLAGAIEHGLSPAEQEMLAIAATLMERIASSGTARGAARMPADSGQHPVAGG